MQGSRPERGPHGEIFTNEGGAGLRRGTARRHLRWVLALGVVATFGCKDEQIHDAAYAGTQGAIDAAVDRAGKLPPDTQEKVNAAVEGVTHSAVTGAGKGVKELELEKNLQSMLQMVFKETNDGTNALVQRLIDEQGDRLEKQTRKLLVGVLNDANAGLRTTTQTELPKAADIMITTAVSSFTTAIGDPKVNEQVTDLREGLVKTTGDVTKTASSKAVEGLREELQKPGTTEALEGMTKALVTGAVEGLKESSPKVPKEYLYFLGIPLGTLLLASIVALVFYILRAWRTEKALSVVAVQLEAPEHAGLRKSIKAHAEKGNIEPYLKKFLNKRGMGLGTSAAAAAATATGRAA